MKILKKVWGISLALILVASLFLMVAPASAATLAWSTVVLPDTTGVTNQIAAGTDVANVTVAPNGDIFVINTAAPGSVIYKSTNGGYTWRPTTVAAGLVDIAVSPSYATDNTVFAVTAGQAYISVNGGTSFAVLGGTLPAGHTATSIAVAPNYSAGNGEVMIGTTTGAAAGDVYIWGKGGVQNWAAQGIALPGPATADVLAVAYSPNFPIDFTRVAITDDGTDSWVQTLRGDDAGWDLLGTGANQLLTTAAGSINGATGASIAFPSDFNSALPQTRVLYAALNVAVSQVFRVTVGNAAAAGAVTITTTFQTGSIAYSGTTAAGTLFAGEFTDDSVWKTTNPTAAQGNQVVWLENYVGPTGATTGPTYVALANDFTTSNKVYAGSAGANSAFNVSDDGGAYFYQTGLIDTAIAAVTGINDFQAASTNDFFMFTNDGGVTADSLWKSTDAGATWKRVLSIVAGTNTAIIRVSPNYATDNTVLYGDLGATAIRMTTDGGKTWVPRTSPFNLGDIALKDGNTFYVGASGAASVDATLNGGWTWQQAPTAVTGGNFVTSLKVDLGTGHILAGCGNGVVSLSTNGNTTFTQLAGIGAASNALVAFDGNYADNNIVYAVGAAGAVGVNRIHVGTPSVAIAMTPGTYAGVASDLIVAPDGTLYVGNVGATTVFRSINPAAGTATNTTAVEWTDMTLALAPAAMSLTQGSNVLFAVSGVAVRTYTDTLSTAQTSVLSPVEGDRLNEQIIQATVEAVDGARNYQVQWNTREDFLGIGEVLVAAWPSTTTALWGTVTAVPAGATLYVRARVQTPLLGPWSETFSIETHLNAAPSTAPGIVGQVGGEGSTAAGGWGVGLTPVFQWAAIGGATAYEFQLASDAAMSDFVIDATGSNALGVVTAYRSAETLDYDTAYFWRVRAISATSVTDWSPVTAFTTLEQAVPTTTGPAPTQTTTSVVITQPAETTQVVEEVAPAYIWAIIAVGAILVIAVIVLIVRTRRTV